MQFNYATKAMTILVYVDSDPTQVEVVNIDEATAEKITRERDRYAMIRQMIARGLRAQLEMQSIVTGQLQIALDIYPDKPAVLTGIDKTTQEIPSIPTPLQELTKKLETLPFDQIFNNINLAADGIAKLVQSPELKESVVNLNTALKDIQTLVRNADAQVKPLSAGLSETIRDTQKLIRNADTQVASVGTNLNEAIGDGRKLIKNVDGSVDSVRAGIVDMIHSAVEAIAQAEKVLAELQSTAKTDSVLMYRVTESLREVEKSARSLRSLTDYLERHPEALLSGKGDGGGN
jgi:paraquat-inducible protein B